MTRSQTTPWTWLGRWGLPMLALAAGLGLALYGLVELGKHTRLGIRDRDRYQVAVADVHCTPPPVQSRSDFLAEVQYLASLPEQLNVLDEQLGARLAAAFALHPWVEKVHRVQISPPRRIQVRLAFRMPILALTIDGQTRVLDRHGVLLPPNADASEVPRYRGRPTPSGGTTGQTMRDEAVLAALKVVSFLADQQERLPWTAVEESKEGIILTGPGKTRVVWGRPPGSQPPTEAPAEQKRDRLLHYCDEHGQLDLPDGPYEHDVRPLGRATRRALKK